MKLYKHQQRFVDRNPDKALLVWEAGTGKSLAAIEWLKLREGRKLLVCPKAIKGKWEKDLEKHAVQRTKVVTKEEFKKMEIQELSALVIDEAHHHSSALFAGKRSKIAEHTYTWIRQFPDMHVLLLTATPIRSTPWNLHTLLTYIGKYIDWKKWQSKFFTLEVRPYLPRPAWLPVKTWRIDIRKALEKNTDIVLMKDCVGELPPITEDIVKVKPKEAYCPLDEDAIDWNPMAEWVAKHRWENGPHKIQKILDIASGYRKVLVVCHYTAQLEHYSKELAKDRPVYSLHGKLSAQKQTEAIASAQNDDECFFIVQAGMGEGYDADTFSCVVFASMSYKYIDFYQMKNRVRRIHNLHPIQYYYLIGGECDTAVYKQVQLGKDFDPHDYLLKQKHE